MIDHLRADQQPAVDSKFFQRNVVEVAPALIGCYVFTNIGGERTGGMIIETEAYDENDPFAHCHKCASDYWRKQSEPMKFEPGYVYLYPSGQLFCLNFVCDRKGFGSAVLIRAILPTCHPEIMLRRRRIANSPQKYLEDTKPWETQLCNGPAVLCEALGINEQHYAKSKDGMSLFDADSPFKIHEALEKPKSISGIGIGLDKQYERWKKQQSDCATAAEINRAAKQKFRWGAEQYRNHCRHPLFSQEWHDV